MFNEGIVDSLSLYVTTFFMSLARTARREHFLAGELKCTSREEVCLEKDLTNSYVGQYQPASSRVKAGGNTANVLCFSTTSPQSNS